VAVASGARAEAAVEVAPGLFVLPGVDEEASPANANAIANTAFRRRAGRRGGGGCGRQLGHGSGCGARWRR
jgi:hypothetical protein